MSFWILTGALALLAAGVMVAALLRRREGAPEAASTASFDMQVYRDQLKELERDLARGTLSAEEGERTRVEISRRLLEADKKARAARTAGQAPVGLTYAAALATVLIVVGGGYALYDRIGAAGYADMGLAARKEMAREARANRESQAEAEAALPAWSGPPPEAPADYVNLVVQLREVVAARPDDVQGLILLADHEEALGNHVAAWKAAERVVQIKGDAASAGDHARQAHLMILAANGHVSPEAEAVLNRALEIDPGNEAARFLSAVLYDQIGRPDIAFQLWRQILEQGHGSSHWQGIVRANIEGLAASAGVNYTPPPAPTMPQTMPMDHPALQPGQPGPSAEDIAAAQDMRPEERQAMIAGMINRLSERLATEGGPPQDWARLIQALGVVGDTERAAAIYAEGKSRFAEDVQGLALLKEAARAAGVAE